MGFFAHIMLPLIVSGIFFAQIGFGKEDEDVDGIEPLDGGCKG